MSALSIGAIAANLVRRKNGRIHRHSYDVGSEKAKPWSRVGDGSRDQWRVFKHSLLRTLEEHIATQRRENYEGDDYLLPIDRLVLAELLDFYNPATGQLDPEQGTIAAKLGYSRSWVNERLQCIQAHGYLDWTRRSIERPGSEEDAPRREQTSNAYYFDWRKSMARRTWARFWQLVTAGLKKLGAALGSTLASLAGPPSNDRDPALARALADCEAAGDRRGWLNPSQ